MKDEYDFSKMRRRAHPLQDKIDKGELKLVSPLDITEEEFNVKISLLDPDTRDTVIKLRQKRMRKQVSINPNDFSLIVIDKMALGTNSSLFTCKYNEIPQEIETRRTFYLSNGARFNVIKNHLPEIPALIMIYVNATEEDLDLIPNGITCALI